MARDTYYEILGVSSTASPVEIRAKYRKLIQRIHPDLDGPAALFRQVQEAYEVLSHPDRRAAYDRSLAADGAARTALRDREARGARETGFREPGPGRSGATGPPGGGRSHSSSRTSSRRKTSHSSLAQHPARAVAVFGAALLAFGAALGSVGAVLLVLGPVVLVLAGVAGLGGRGGKEHEEYQRSGMAAVDAMTGRQFEVLLEHFFANKGYRVARLRVRGESCADLLLNGPRGRTIVQVRRWDGVVQPDAVQQAVVARARYGVARAMLVTSSVYSDDAITVANSQGVTLWNRTVLAAELSTFRGQALQSGVPRFSSDLRAGTRILLGFMATLLLSLVVVSTAARGRRPGTRHR